MAQVLTHMAEAIIDTLLAAWTWLIGFNWNPATWINTTWAVLFGLALVVVLFWLPAVWRRQARRLAPYTRPELLVTQGEILPGEGHDLLKLAINNLSPYPVQVLELALPGATNPLGWLELTPLLDVGASVRLEEAIAPLQGQQGELWVYIYTPATPKKLFRLSATYSWEPWRERHKISPLGQRIEPAKELASTLAKRQREAQWRRSERERQRAEAQRRRQAERLERARQEVRPSPEPPEPDNPAPQNAPNRAKIDFPNDF
jgi:hypothetical protein